MFLTCFLWDLWSVTDCASRNMPIGKGEKFSFLQCPRNDLLKKKEMEKIPYYLVIGNLIYAQVYMHLDIVYIVRILGRYLSNSRIDHHKSSKMSYLVFIKNKKEDHLLLSAAL